MRYVVLGAGAVGGSIGAALFAAGQQVVLVARGAHQSAIATAGLEFITPRSADRLAMPVADGPDQLQLRPDDVLVVGVKVQDSTALLDQWRDAPVQGGGTAGSMLPVLCLQNGVEGERIALRRFARVYGASVMLPAAYLLPGQIVSYGHPLVGVLAVGRYPAGVDALVEHLCSELEGAGIGAVATDDVLRWKYAKLLSNLGNALEAVTGPVTSAAAVEVFHQAQLEGRAVLRAAGIDTIDAQQETALRQRTETVDIPGRPRGGGSTWQSLQRGTGHGAGTVEADYLSGEIVLLGRLFGVDTPVNDTLCGLVRDLARSGRPPGSVSVAELVSAVAGHRTGTGASRPG